jgi:hypothetical protein
MTAKWAVVFCIGFYAAAIVAVIGVAWIRYLLRLGSRAGELGLCAELTAWPMDLDRLHHHRFGDSFETSSIF